MKILTFVNNMKVLDLFLPSKYYLLFMDFTIIIQNLPISVKTSLPSVCSSSLELHGAFSGKKENEEATLT